MTPRTGSGSDPPRSAQLRRMPAAGLAKVSRPASCAPSTARERTRSAHPVQIRNRSAASLPPRQAHRMIPLADRPGPASPDSPSGLSHPILAFRHPPVSDPGGLLPLTSLPMPGSVHPPIQDAAASSSTTGSGLDPPLDSGPSAGHQIIMMRQQTDLVLAGP